MLLPSIWLGKIARLAVRLRGGDGSAAPGLVVEKFNRQFVGRVLERLTQGVVVISGTNGKTTTTKMVAQLLSDHGLRVFTNPSGSNFVRGIISEMLARIGLFGKFPYDIAVLELDEAHAVKFGEVAQIDYVLLLNVAEDQNDRFSTKQVAQLLSKIAGRARKGVIVNREDVALRQISGQKVQYFGLADGLRKQFLLSKTESKLPTVVKLVKLYQTHASYEIGGGKYDCTLKLKGNYNAFNAAGALALVKMILPAAQNEQLAKNLGQVASAAGRGESFQIGGIAIELFLVKNPSAFQLSLNSFVSGKHDYMVAINNNAADGRDISWLDKVDYRALRQVTVVSGAQAEQMAAVLSKAGVKVERVETDLGQALENFLTSSARPKRIFANYTAMMTIRKILAEKSRK